MGSKSARHAHRAKARRRRERSSGAGEGLRSAGTAGALARLAAYADGGTLADAAAAARTRLDESLEELVDLVAPYDPWDIVELLRVRCTPPAPSADGATDPTAIASLVELVAVIVTCDGPGAGEERASSATPALASPVIDDVHRLALSCLRTGSEAIAFDRAAAGGDLARIRAGAVLREVAVRNQVYPHMLRDTLRALFGTPEMEQCCRATLGFTVDDAIAVLDACSELRGRVWAERMSAVAGTARLAMFLGETAQQKTASDPVLADYRKRALVHARQAVEAASANPADDVARTAARLAAHTGRAPDLVAAVLDVFALQPQQCSPREAALEFFAGTSALRLSPLLRDDSGRVLLVHDALHLPAIREAFEQRLKDAGRWDAYSKHRGAHLEDAAAELFVRHLPGVDVQMGFEYFVPDPDPAAPQNEPAQYTKRAEGDVLLVVDDVAIIIEAKAVALNPRARAGDTLRLRRDLTRIVTAAAAQAQRLRERIDADHGLLLRDGSWLDLAHVREVHAVAVSLEDLSGVATTTTDLVRAGLLPAADLPWTVSLHDLRIVSELIDRPAELVLYLRRRTEAETTQKFEAVDELDFFLHFYDGGLYVEPDPDRVAAELPHAGPPNVAARRRRKAERATVLASRTDRLDAWYFHQLGHSPTSADKPVMLADTTVLDLIDEITAWGGPGWLSTTVTLLDGSAKAQRQYGTTPRKLCAMTAQDGRPHSVTVTVGTTRLNSHVLIWRSVPDPSLQTSIHSQLRRHLQAKKHQTQAARATGLLIDASSGTLTHVEFDNRVVGPDPQLDRLVVEMGLTPESTGPRSLPPPKIRERRRPSPGS